VLDPETLLLKRTLNVRLSGRPLPRLNELEWIEGEIWANVWQANQLVRIDPESGDVVGIVDLRGLLDPRDRRPDTDVLNGIAWDAEQRALWVTGKRWPWLYQIRLIAQPGARP
jgi:glutamine cyclotransferase